MVHTYTGCNDNVSVITKKGNFSFIGEYRGTSSRSSCDVIDDVITMKIFFCIIWDDLSVSNVKLKLHWIFQNNSKRRNFRAGGLFRRRCHRKLNTLSGKPRTCPTFWAFDKCSSLQINGVMAISKFDPLFYLVTYFFFTFDLKILQVDVQY